MKLESAAVSKGRAASHHLCPREGSRTRKIYDMFMAKKGVLIEWKVEYKSDSYRIDQLRNVYGLDIRCLRQGRWVLAGEWFGKVYVDYIAKVLENNSQRRNRK